MRNYELKSSVDTVKSMLVASKFQLEKVGVDGEVGALRKKKTPLFEKLGRS
jgi:hypothetical protein